MGSVIRDKSGWEKYELIEELDRLEDKVARLVEERTHGLKRCDV